MSTVTMDQLAAVLQQAQTDPAFRAELLASPATTLESSSTNVVVPVPPSASDPNDFAVVTSDFSNIAQLITAGSYLADVGFAAAGVLQFKSHKDNPTQIPIGTPIALLFVAAALTFIPTIVQPSG